MKIRVLDGFTRPHCCVYFTWPSAGTWPFLPVCGVPLFARDHTFHPTLPFSFATYTILTVARSESFILFRILVSFLSLSLLFTRLAAFSLPFATQASRTTTSLSHTPSISVTCFSLPLSSSTSCGIRVQYCHICHFPRSRRSSASNASTSPSAKRHVPALFALFTRKRFTTLSINQLRTPTDSRQPCQQTETHSHLHRCTLHPSGYRARVQPTELSAPKCPVQLWPAELAQQAEAVKPAHRAPSLHSLHC